MAQRVPTIDAQGALVGDTLKWLNSRIAAAAGGGQSWTRGDLQTPQDVDLMRGPSWSGLWDIPGGSVADAMSGTRPSDLTIWMPGQFIVFGRGSGSTNLASQLYLPYTTGKGVWYRTITNYRVTGAAAWSPWTNLASSAASSGPTRNAMLLDDYTMRTGPVLTGGKTAIALRFDHGLTTMKSTILPLLRERGFPATVAMNARNWDLPENSGATQEEADSWSDVEFTNHGATHGDADTPDALQDEIVNGRNELQAQLPNHRIDGFMIPGTTSSQYMGWGTGKEATAFSDTFTGRLILDNHAWSAGYRTGSSATPMDGVLRQGMGHNTYETWSLSKFKTRVDEVIEAGTGLALMMHPRTLNASGYITTATLTAMLDYIKAKVDAGLVVVVPFGKLLLADKYTGVSSPEVTSRLSAVESSAASNGAAVKAVADRATALETRTTAIEAARQDTKWRDVTALLTPARTSGRVLLRRQGGVCRLVFDQMVFAAAGSGNLVVLPTGFRPAVTEPNTAQGLSLRVQVTIYGNVQAYAWTTAPVVGSLTWFCDEPHPASSAYPGTPIT